MCSTHTHTHTFSFYSSFHHFIVSFSICSKIDQIYHLFSHFFVLSTNINSIRKQDFCLFFIISTFLVPKEHWIHGRNSKTCIELINVIWEISIFKLQNCTQHIWMLTLKVTWIELGFKIACTIYIVLSCPPLSSFPLTLVLFLSLWIINIWICLILLSQQSWKLVWLWHLRFFFPPLSS